jgi:integrase
MKADRELAQVYAGIRNTTGTKQEGKAAVTLKLIRRMVDIVEGGSLTASRDRALILIGFAGGLRRSELAGIRFEHLQWHSSGSGKRDHDYAAQVEDRPGGAGKGSRDRARQSARAYAAIRMHLPRTALDQWLRQAGIASGPVFCKVNFGENVQKGNTSRNGPPRRLRRTQFT